MVAHLSADWPVPRRFHRFSLNSAVEVCVPEWIALRARCVDVSLGGIRIRLNQAVRPGDRLEFEARLPGGGILDMLGVVVHVGETGDGYCDAGICWLGDEDDAVMVFEAVVADI